MVRNRAQVAVKGFAIERHYDHLAAMILGPAQPLIDVGTGRLLAHGVNCERMKPAVMALGGSVLSFKVSPMCPVWTLDSRKVGMDRNTRRDKNRFRASLPGFCYQRVVNFQSKQILQPKYIQRPMLAQAPK